MADFPSPSSAYGRWGLMDVRDAVMGGNWPTTPLGDEYFEYVTMLLPGNGTNGAQNNTFLDSSTNNFTITRNGNTTQGSFSPYGSNWGNFFDGTGDYLASPSNVAFNVGTGDFTSECWAFLTDNVNVGIFELEDGPLSGTFTGLMFWSQSDGYWTLKIGSTTVLGTSSTPAPLNTWTHLAVTRNSGTLNIFQNGVSIYSGTHTDDLSSKTVLTVGGIYTSSYCMQGYLSNFRFIKGTALYTSNFTPSTTPLTAISGTSLLTCQSNRFVDNSTNNFSLTIGGTPSVQRFNPFGASTAYSTSVIGGSGYFDGSSDYLKTVGSVGINNSAFTICCWFYPLNSSVIGLFDSGPNNPDVFRNYPANTIEYQAGGSSVSIAGDYQVNAWNWMCITKSGTSFTVYINGVNAGAGTCATTMVENQFTVGTINNGGDGSYLGYISDFQVLNTSTVVSVPTAPITNASGKTYLLNFQNGAIFDNAMMNDLETVGNAQISTSVVKYGTGSLAFDGTGDYLSGPTTPTTALGSGAYTIEFWLYKDSTGTGERGIFQTQTASLYGLSIFADGTTIYIDERTNSFNGSDPRISGTISQDTWIHVAICRQTGTSGTLRAFINGTQIGSSVTANLRNLTSTGPIVVGNTAVAANPLKGYIDDLRITNGYARYTANFTPPTEAFPTF